MKKVKTFGIIALVLGIMAVTFLMDIPTFMKIKRGQIKDFNSVAAGELQKGDAVSGTIDMAFGPVAEEYSTTYGVRTSDKSSKLYYALWMDNDQFVLYETGSNDEYTTLDRIVAETENYFDSLDEADETGDITDLMPPTTTLQLEGRVTNLSGEIKDLFEEWYGEGFETECEPVMITHVVFDRFGTMIYAGLGCALLCVVMLVVTFIAWRKSRF